MEKLEKRVLSRFSQKILYTFNQDSFEEYMEHVYNILQVSDPKINKMFMKAVSENVVQLFKILYNSNNSLGKLFNVLVLFFIIGSYFEYFKR